MKTENFYDTDPIRLKGKELKDPFLAAEEFFCIQGLPSWRREIKTWFKNALSADYECEKPGEFHFFHEKLTNLIEAGFLISQQRLTYQPKITHCEKYTAGEWFLRVRNKRIAEDRECLKESEPQLLTPEEIADPDAFIYDFCAFTNVVKLRKTLYDWAQAVLGSEPLWEVDFDDDLWGGYEGIEKLIEGFYWVLVKDAKDPEQTEPGEPTTDNNPPAPVSFHDTDPNRLAEDYLENPFQFIEDFFWIMSFAQWKESLTDTFGLGLTTTTVMPESASNLLFEIQKLTNLLEAGFLISQHRLIYYPKKRYRENKFTAGEWLLQRDPDLRILQQPEIKANPLKFIYNFFVPEKVKQLRESLNNWHHAALGSGPLWEMEDGDNIWQSYTDLQQIIDVFYLLLVKSVEDMEEDLEPINPEILNPQTT